MSIILWFLGYFVLGAVVVVCIDGDDERLVNWNRDVIDHLIKRTK